MLMWRCDHQLHNRLFNNTKAIRFSKKSPLTMTTTGNEEIEERKRLFFSLFAKLLNQFKEDNNKIMMRWNEMKMKSQPNDIYLVTFSPLFGNLYIQWMDWLVGVINSMQHTCMYNILCSVFTLKSNKSVSAWEFKWIPFDIFSC